MYLLYRYSCVCLRIIDVTLHNYIQSLEQEQKHFHNNVGMAVPKIIQTRCSTYAARQWMIAYNNKNMRNPLPTSFIMGLRMLLLLLYAIIHCLAVCMIFGTAITTLLNILMKMFLLLSILSAEVAKIRAHSKTCFLI